MTSPSTKQISSGNIQDAVELYLRSMRLIPEDDVTGIQFGNLPTNRDDLIPITISYGIVKPKEVEFTKFYG